MIRRWKLSWACILLLACSSDGSAPTRPTQLIFGGDRPTPLFVPDDYDHSKPTPLLLVLHGYGASGYLQLAYTRTRDLPDDVGTLMIAPEGIIGADGMSSWNASEVCCGVHDTDDVAYLVGLIDEVSAVWNVDPRRIYLFGHSNGGFMSYRLACERPDLFAGIASLAGAGWDGCNPSEKVSILQIHGTEDDVISMDGGSLFGLPYLSAQASLDAWSGYNGCGSDWQAGPQLDIEVDLAGAETSTTYNAACGEVGVELWTITGGSHIPGFRSSFPVELWRWLSEHPRS